MSEEIKKEKIEIKEENKAKQENIEQKIKDSDVKEEEIQKDTENVKELFEQEETTKEKEIENVEQEEDKEENKEDTGEENREENEKDDKEEEQETEEGIRERNEAFNKFMRYIEDELGKVLNPKKQKEVINKISNEYGKKLSEMAKELQEKEEALRKVKAELERLLNGQDGASDLFMLLVSLGLSKGLKELTKTYRQLVLNFKKSYLEYVSSVMTFEKNREINVG